MVNLGWRSAGLWTDLSLTQHSAAGRVAREVMRWAVSLSLAATREIAFAFFSSAN